MKPIETYCSNIQICSDIDEIKALMFTDEYCDRNPCFNCPFHPRAITIKVEAKKHLNNKRKECKIMDFGKWLERMKGKAEIVDNDIEVVSVHALGEWAWQELLKLLAAPENVRKARCHEYNLLMDIAVACLGKAEVEKRLKEKSS